MSTRWGYSPADISSMIGSATSATLSGPSNGSEASWSAKPYTKASSRAYAWAVSSTEKPPPRRVPRSHRGGAAWPGLASARLQERDRPGMEPQDATGRVRSPADLRTPVATHRRHLDLAEHHVDDAVQDLLLVGDVVIDRHRLDTELLGERADRQRSDPSPSATETAPRSTRSRLSPGRLC